jgi:hypothetical protein
MGKNTQKVTESFNKVVTNRTVLLEQIKKCTSLEALESLRIKYSANKNNNYFVGDSIGRKLSNEKQRVLTDLHNNIISAIKAQEIKLSPIPTALEVGSSVRSEHVDLVEEGSRVEPLLERVEESITTHFQELRKIAISHIEDELVNVAKKCERMSKKGAAYEKATQATQNIHDAITNLVAKYVQDGDAQHFQDETKALFDETTEDMKTINEHRGWAKNFFGNLAYFILGVGVGYAAVCAYRGKFFEFNTETANVVGVVNEKITALTQGLI